MAYELGNGTTFDLTNTALCAVTIDLPEVSVGDQIDTTCLANTAYKTGIAPVLKTVGQITVTGNLKLASEATIADLDAEVGVNQAAVITYGDADTSTYYGYVKSYKLGTQEADTLVNTVVVFEVTNQNAGVETGPAHVDTP